MFNDYMLICKKTNQFYKLVKQNPTVCIRWSIADISINRKGSEDFVYNGNTRLTSLNP